MFRRGRTGKLDPGPGPTGQGDPRGIPGQTHSRRSDIEHGLLNVGKARFQIYDDYFTLYLQDGWPSWVAFALIAVATPAPT